MQKLIAASILVIASCGLLRAQVPSASPKKPDEPATGVISGKVVNESGQPLAGASLFVRPVNAPGNARTATSDLEGNFRVSGLEPLLYTVTGNAPAYTTVPNDSGVPTYYRIGDTVNLELIRGGAITGTVTNSLGEPVVAVRVRATMVRDTRGEAPKSSFTTEQPTDDRGVYRIYGLRPGTYIVSAGGPGFSPTFNPYDSDAATFAPSSTRDNAAEVVVRSNDDSTIDIRYRGEAGHVISGTIKFGGTNGASVTLAQAGSSAFLATTFQPVGGRGFAFYGLGDGDYDLIAQENLGSPTAISPTFALSESKRVTIKGNDVTGIELVTRPLGSISGKIAVESSKVPECHGKRTLLLTETIVRLQRPEKDADKDLFQARMFISSASPDASGAFVLRNVVPGKYLFDPLFYARYWYLQSITTSTGTAKPQKVDAAANWTTLKSGDQLANLTITIAEGAASIRGRMSAPEGAATTGGMSVYLVPAEPDKADDVLRYFVSAIGDDQTFAFNNVPPGKYLTMIDTSPSTISKLRLPESAQTRTKLRRAAEAKKNAIELKSCQTLTDFQLKP
jgi:Carboxypeptidase regulatory-like domain